MAKAVKKRVIHQGFSIVNSDNKKKHQMAVLGDITIKQILAKNVASALGSSS